MASRKDTEYTASEGPKNAPAWANGLKQLYDDVVDEPLPDAFKDLLAQLDSADDTPSKGGS